MNYLKIQNKGVLPQSLFFMMGASTKTDDVTKIGEFGTGLKYAIAYCLRTKTKLIVFLGTRKLEFTTKIKKIKGKNFECIYINNKNTNLTTKFGATWETWMAIREVWCNAIDESKPSMEEIPEGHTDVKFGKPGHTTFLIQIDERVSEVIKNWDSHFLTRDDALFEDDDIAVYPSNGENLKVYKKGILIYSNNRPCFFHYDIKRAELNELREYKGILDYDVPNKLLFSNQKVINILLDEMNKAFRRSDRPEYEECNLDYYLWDGTEDRREKVKILFSGRLYISRKSDKSSKHGTMVSDSLLDVLNKCDLKTRNIHYSSGYGYGGYGGSDYEIIKHPRLEERLGRFIKDLGIYMPFEVMVPINGDDKDFLYKSTSVVFNATMEHKDDRELKAIILSAYIMNQNDKKYVTMKRLIKGFINNQKRLKSILQL